MTSTSQHYDPSCMDDFDPASLDAGQALTQIINTVTRPHEVETVPIQDSLGRVIASESRSRINVPGHTNSAMDGYAICGKDIPAREQAVLSVIGTSWAGRPFTESIRSGECVRIMTGAAMPDGSDTVVMQERVEKNGDTISLDSNNKPGQNVRQAGEDIQAGEIVLESGKHIRPAELGLLASTGIGEVTVYKKLRVAFFSTGDELRPIGSKLQKGQIYDSNRYTLYGMLSRLGVEITDLGVIGDERNAIEQVFSDAAAKADVVITSGGVSVGEADFVKEILEQHGTVHFWKVAMKPGRPLAFGKIGNAWFFGLPGNPVSVMVTFYVFVLPALRKMMGNPHQEPLTVTATCSSSLRKRAGRVEYQRGILTWEKDGGSSGHSYRVSKTGPQGSGVLRSMSDANCFIILPMESSGVEAGDEVRVLPFETIV
ncbi:MAG: molybdopterin molybdotransferase MoeA [Gammaproteobacteria bacterium]|nr:molybdopterin molybdotransferase MoeA [Gammaproteobacteria bacterium]